MAKIEVDLEKRIGSIHPFIYGHFIEHLGRCIYGGIYEPKSSLSDEHGFRQDVLKVVKDLRVPILRWPGGNFASGYHWQDGIGSREKRPSRFDLAWKAVENNQFGTDEFIQYCRILQTEPYICVNMGSGTAEEAAAWVEYCNGETDTVYANLRRKSGHPQPYMVQYWGLGNEIYGDWQIGHKTAEDYAKQAVEFAKLMKRVDRKIKLIACGAGEEEWDEVVLTKVGKMVDYISIHSYHGATKEDPYYSVVGAPVAAERKVRDLTKVIERVAKSEDFSPVKISYDEWNVCYRKYPHREHKGYYVLADALFTASFLNMFHRNCQWVTMANLAQMVNVLAPVFTSPQGLFLHTIYFPLKLYANYCQGTALACSTESDGFDVKTYGLKNIPYLDVSATVNEGKSTLSLACVNRSHQDDIEASVKISPSLPSGEARIFEVNADDPMTFNSFKQPNKVRIRERKLKVSSSFKYMFPSHSLSVLVLDL